MSDEHNKNKKNAPASKGDNKPQQKVEKNSRGQYRVVFKGKLLEGFSKADVIKNIARLTKISEEKIEKKFFSGKAVVIRRAHDQAHAQKLQQLFTKAGLVVIILKDELKAEPIDQHEEKEKTSRVVIEKELREIKKNVQQRKRPILFAVAAIIIISVLLSLWNRFNISVETPETVLAIEQSLANEALVFMAHVNVERLLSLQSYLVDDPKALPGTDSTLHNKLRKAGIDPLNSIQQILTASYLKDKQVLTHHILLGQFSVPAVKRFLTRHYFGEAIPETGYVRMRIAELDEVSCQKDNYKEVAIEPNRILIAADGHLDDLRALLEKPAGNNTDLNRWSEYRGDKLLSMALFKPEQGSQLTSGLSSMMARGLVQKNKALDSLFAGIGTQLVPPAGLVDVRLNSNDDAWLEKTGAAVNSQLVQMKTQTQGVESLQLLLDKVSVSDRSGQLSLALQLDGEIRQSIETSLKDLATQMLSFGATTDTATAGAQEKIDTQAIQYLAQLQSGQMDDYNEQLDQFFKPSWVGGPFAVAVEELLVEQDQIVLQLHAKGQNIANMGSHQASLKVIAVNDKQGNNVLQQQKCGRPLEQTTTLFSSWGGIKTGYVNNQSVQYSEIEARSKATIKAGVKFTEIESLQADIELHLPTRTEAEVFARPQQNKLLNVHDTRVLFRPVSGNTLSYTISGDEKHILTIRALNSKKQPLSRSSSSSMSSLWGSGRSVSQSYQGEIAFVEVVYASELETLNYPVTIKRFPPYYSENRWHYDPTSIKILSLQQWQERYDDLPAMHSAADNIGLGQALAQWHKGPFNLALYGLQSSKHWGTRGQLHIKTPLIEELENNLSMVEVFLNYPQPAENGDVGISYFQQLKAKGYYMNGKFIADKNKPYMDSQLSFTLPAYKDQQAIKAVSGEIIVHLPVATNTSTYREFSIGTEWEDVGLKAKIVRVGRNQLEFAISGNRERLVQITLLDHENRRISTADINAGFGTPSQSNNIVVNYHGIPAKAQLTVAEGQRLKRYPFKLVAQ